MKTLTSQPFSLTIAVRRAFLGDSYMDAMERLRRRLALLLDDRTPTGQIRQKHLTRFLGKSEAWLANILSGKRGLRLVDLDPIAEFFRVPPSELVRAQDAELIEVTPTELALLRKIRRADPTDREAILTVIGIAASKLPPKKVRRKKSGYGNINIHEP